MNRQRLEHLIDTLKHVPDEQFDMSMWWQKHDGCSTFACAAGWEAMTPYAIHHGLKIKKFGTYKNFGIPTYRHKEGTEALMAYFDLDEEAAYWIFTESEWFTEDDEDFEESAAQVAERIICVLEAV